MAKQNNDLGTIPSWLQERSQKTEERSVRLEIEVKYLLPKAVLPSIKKSKMGLMEQQELDQIYLTSDVVEPFAEDLELPPDTFFKEWRVRRIDDKFFFTAKGSRSRDGAQREEFEIPISKSLFSKLRLAAEKQRTPYQVCKTRYSFPVSLADDMVLVEIDDYHKTGSGSVELDFITCEVEVHKPELADILQKGRFFAPDLLFLKQGVDVTGVEVFSNREIAENGFVANSYSELVDWLTQNYMASLDHACESIRKGTHRKGCKSQELL